MAMRHVFISSSSSDIVLFSCENLADNIASFLYQAYSHLKLFLKLFPALYVTEVNVSLKNLQSVHT